MAWCYTMLLLKCLLFGLALGEEEKVTPYIIGGETTDVSRTPWVVSIHMNGSHTCGGILIDATTLVTAGHCFPNMTGYSVEIDRGMPSAEIIYLNQITIHEKYNKTNNDIAIAKLEKPANIPSYATLGTTDVTGSLAHVAGWGVEAMDGQATKTLKRLDVSVLAIPKCEEIPEFDPSIMICAAPNTTETACLGDSGGPLFISSNTVVGIVSYGVNCTGAVSYTKIAAFEPWIRRKQENPQYTPPSTTPKPQTPSEIPPSIPTQQPEPSSPTSISPPNTSQPQPPQPSSLQTPPQPPSAPQTPPMPPQGDSQSPPSRFQPWQKKSNYIPPDTRPDNFPSSRFSQQPERYMHDRPFQRDYSRFGTEFGLPQPMGTNQPPSSSGQPIQLLTSAMPGSSRTHHLP